MATRERPGFKPVQLDNPLFHHYADIDKAARDFAVSIGADEDLCLRAAQIACDPPTWKDVDGLTEQEKKALEAETHEGFFGQTKSLRLVIVTLCFSAMVQGWIQSVSNGANQTMPEYFCFKHDGQGACDGRAIPADFQWANNGPAIWRFAAINAITYLTAGIFGCWFSDPLQSSMLGRRGAIFASACLCIAASIGAASVRAPHWWQLLIWRGILGLGLGAKASITPIYGAEVSPARLRGRLVMNWQLFDALGIFCGFSANLVFFWTNQLAWRFQIASACIPAGALVVLIWACPESPRWLLKKGRGQEAFASLCALRRTPLQAATELFFANAQLQRELEYTRKKKGDPEALKNSNTAPDTEKDKANPVDDSKMHDLGNFSKYKEAVSASTYWSRILQLFANPRTRRATVAASVVMLGQQLCGVNVLAFYSTVFIQNINSQSTKSIKALWLSWGLGLANFLFTFPAYHYIDRLGRRFLLLATYPGMILSLLGACLSFLGDTGPEADSDRTVRVSVFMFFFILFYSLGQGPVAFTYCAEVFPLFNREVGMSFGVFMNLVGAGLLTLFVPRAQVSASTYRHDKPPHPQKDWLNRQAELVGAFVILCTFSMVLIYFFVPETKLATISEDGKRTLNYISLEELNQIFAVETRDCWKYYINHVAYGTFHNFLHWLRLRPEKMRIYDSMYLWSQEKLERKKSLRMDVAESEKTEVDTDSQHEPRPEQPDPDSFRHLSTSEGPTQPKQRTRIQRKPVGSRPSNRASDDGAKAQALATHVEDAAAAPPTGVDTISPASLPRVDYTGGSIGYYPGQRRQTFYADGTPVDPDRRYSGGERGQSFGLG